LRFLIASGFNITDIPVNVGERHVFIHRYDGVSEHDVYDSAKGVWESFSGASTQHHIDDRLWIGTGFNAQLPCSFELFVAGMGTAPSLAALKSAALNPYQILKPKTQPVYWTVGAASGAFTLTADTAAYTYSGTDASLLLSAILGADTAQYTYSGTSVDLTFAGAGSFTLNAETAQYSYSGTNAGLLLAANLDAETAQYTYSGANATLTKNFSMTGDTAQYTYSGTDAAMQLGAVMVTESTQYTYSGSNISFQVSGRVVIGVTMYPNLDNRTMFIT
jgi:hypothetical protein